MNLEFEFTGEIFYWRGPAPFFFITVPEAESAQIKSVSSMVTYGWGVIPATVKIGDTEFKTALFPKDGRYLVPVKANVRKAEELDTGDTADVQLTIVM